MLRHFMTGKIHRAVVTQSDLHYVGSVTIDSDLLDAAGISEGEKVSIVDITNGSRLDTYAIAGARGSGVLGINGAAAHLVAPGDLVIVIAYGILSPEEVEAYAPRVVHVDSENQVVALGADAAEPVPGSDTRSGR